MLIINKNDDSFMFLGKLKKPKLINYYSVLSTKITFYINLQMQKTTRYIELLFVIYFIT